jgi:hypothetical protein
MALARHPVAARPDALGFLHMDGHARVYYGTRQMQKTHAARLKFPRPATMETWVTEQNGDPCSWWSPSRRTHSPGSCAGCCTGWSAADVAGRVIGDLPGPWGQMPLGELLERSAMEFLVHTWDVAQATGQVAVLDPGLVRDSLGPARRFAPLARLPGAVGPEYALPGDADDLTRLLAIFGRPNTGS